MYHYVREVKKSIYPNLKALELKNFINQINFFKKKFNVLDYPNFIEILNSKKIPKKPSVLLTFDDGYLDHYKNVFPILSKKKISGIFYPPIKILNNKNMLDVNMVHFILEKNIDKKIIINEIENLSKKYLNKNLDQLNIKKIDLWNRWDDKDTTLIKKLLQYYLPDKFRSKILKKVFNKFVNFSEKEFSKKLYINKKNIIEMKNNNMFFGIHGFNHKRLARLSYVEQNDEVSKSIQEFKKLNIKPKNLSICYPYGSYNQTTIKIIKKHKINFGLTLKIDSLSKKNLTNIYEIPRYDCNDFLKF